MIQAGILAKKLVTQATNMWYTKVDHTRAFFLPEIKEYQTRQDDLKIFILMHFQIEFLYNTKAELIFCKSDQTEARSQKH